MPTCKRAKENYITKWARLRYAYSNIVEPDRIVPHELPSQGAFRFGVGKGLRYVIDGVDHIVMGTTVERAVGDSPVHGENLEKKRLDE